MIYNSGGEAEEGVVQRESGVEPKALRDWWTMQGGGGRNQMGKGGKVGL